jgi:hypothetical protein
MRTFPFEKDLINETIVRWVSDHRDDPECRRVLDAHERAQRLGTKEAIESYEKALRELWYIRPWDCGALGMTLLRKPCAVLTK